MADDDHFLGVGGARDLDEVLREAVDAAVPVRPRAVREPASEMGGPQLER